MTRSVIPGPAATAGPGDSLLEAGAADAPCAQEAVPLHLVPVRSGVAQAEGCCDGSREAREACRRERRRLEANKVAAARLLQVFDNPVLALREYNRYVRDLNASIRMHNAVCKPYPISPLST